MAKRRTAGKADGGYLLSLDAGTGSVRGLLFDLAGRCVQVQVRPRKFMPDPGGQPFTYIFDAPALWQKIGDVIRALLSATGAGPESILGVATSCQRFSCLFLDGQGETLYAGPNMDPRGVFTQADVEERLGPEFYRLTGQWPPLLSGLSKILWFRQEAPRVFERIRTVFMLDDWMSFKLTGERTGEITAASASGFLELASPRWSQTVLDTFGLDREWFPRLVFPGEMIGEVSRQAARETGLRAGTPVVAGGADTQSALLGTGLWGPGRVGIAAGTTAPVCLWSDRPVLDPEQRLWSSWHVQPGTWILEANSQWSGSIYQWLAGFFQGAGIRPSARRSVYDWMEAQAQGLPPGANDTFACLGPILMDAKLFHLVRPGVFLFPPPGHLMTESPVMPAHFIRATLENIAFAMRGNIELACGSQTSPLDGLFLTGGLAKSRLFCQILADCTGLVVRVGRESEGTALGAAVCAAAGIRAFPDMASAQKGLVHLDRLVEPSSENTELYQPAYERWRELYAKTEEL